MDTINNKHYIGFEDEPEIQFIRVSSSGVRFILQIWVGYFDEIMSTISPMPDGWSCLASKYHLNKGWYEESPWQILDTGIVIEEFRNIDRSDFNEHTTHVFNDIFQLLLDAKSKNELVWITYF